MIHLDERTQRQIQGLQKWRLNKGIGGLEWSTGVGKTTAAIWFAIKTTREKHPTCSIGVVVHNPNMKKTWKANLKRFKVEDVVVATASEFISEAYRKDHPLAFDLVVLDEPMSMMGTETKQIWSGTIIAKWWLWLDASMDRDNPTVKEFLKIFPMVDYIGEKEAMAKGFTSKSIIINYGLDLPEDIKVEYEELSMEIEILRKSFGKEGLAAANWCLSGKSEQNSKGDWIRLPREVMVMKVAASLGYTSDISTRIVQEQNELRKLELIRTQIECNPQSLLAKASTLMELTRKRVFMLYKHERKIEVAKAIIKALVDKKIICFSESREFIKDLTNQLNLADIAAVSCYSDRENMPMGMGIDGLSFYPISADLVKYKSGEKKGQTKMFGDTSLNNAAKSDFKFGIVTKLISGRSMVKGYDDPKIQIVMICSGSSNADTFVQKKGRSERLDVDDPDKTAVTICLYFQNTVDQYWLNRYQKKTTVPITSLIEPYHSVNDIKNIIDGTGNSDQQNGQAFSSIFS